MEINDKELFIFTIFPFTSFIEILQVVERKKKMQIKKKFYKYLFLLIFSINMYKICMYRYKLNNYK